MKATVLLSALLITVPSLRAADALVEHLQKGLFEEEANHNLPAAISQYQTVIDQADQSRKLAATALFRLGETYRKLGREEDAKKSWTRLLRDYSDQDELVKRATDAMPGLRPEGKSAIVELKLPRVDPFASLEKLLDSSPDLLNSAEPNGVTPLQGAVEEGNLEKIAFLIRKGANVNKLTKSRPAALSIAVERGNRSAAELLLSAGAEVNPKVGQPPLFAAAARGYTQISELLISRGAKVNARDARGLTPLFEAAAAGQVEEIEFLAKKGADLEAVIGAGLTPLTDAISSDKTEAVVTLLKLGANPDAGKPVSALALAVGRRNLTVIRALLATGAKADSTDENGETPLMIATKLNDQTFSVTMMNLLMEQKADPNATNHQGQTPLHFAVSNTRLLAPTLLAHGADPNAKDEKGLTPLLYAVGGAGWIQRVPYTQPYPVPSQVAPDKVQALLEGKADPNIPDRNGRTPLFFAAYSNSQEVVKLLLAAGADPNAKDNSGLTPIRYATSEDIQQILRKAGATEEAPALKPNPFGAPIRPVPQFVPAVPGAPAGQGSTQ